MCRLRLAGGGLQSEVVRGGMQRAWTKVMVMRWGMRMPRAMGGRRRLRGDGGGSQVSSGGRHSGHEEVGLGFFGRVKGGREDDNI